MVYKLVCLFIILKCIGVTKCHVEYIDDYYQDATEGADVRGALKSKSLMRCTRRFTPGYCVTPLRPVWTYIFQEFKCTERLGCRARSRFNRFDSRESCELRCRDLMLVNYIGRTRNRTDDEHDDNSRRQMSYTEEEKIKKYARDEKAEDDARHQDDGPLEEDDYDDRYTTETDIDAPDDDDE